MEHDIAVMLPNENKMNKTIYTFKLRICFFFCMRVCHVDESIKYELSERNEKIFFKRYKT